MSQREVSALTSRLRRLWNPDCVADAQGGVVVRIRVKLTREGRFASPPTLESARGEPADVAAASSRRALAAVEAGQPYAELEPDHFGAWRDMILNFNAKQACAKP
jgi:hypothetical protein